MNHEGTKGHDEKSIYLVVGNQFFLPLCVLCVLCVLRVLCVHPPVCRWIEWQVRWRGDEATVRWEEGALVSENAATAAFARFAVSNAPTTDRPPEERLRDAAIAEEMLHEFADVVLATERGADAP